MEANRYRPTPSAEIGQLQTVSATVQSTRAQPFASESKRRWDTLHVGMRIVDEVIR
jgi:hypothetical protein